MKDGIGIFLSAGCLSLLLAACGGEEQVLAPELQETTLLSALVVSTTDPEGDALGSQGSGLTGEAYQDIVRAEVNSEDATFAFAMDVAANVPAAPVLPGGITVQEWSWNINTSPALPRGFPFSPGSATPPEFIVMVLWDGIAFTGTLIDRRPLLSGGEAVSTSIPVEIVGARISAAVNANLLDDPPSFAWIARANDWPHLGSNSLQTLDRAPDIEPAFWP
jgi:hypothetical protein